MATANLQDRMNSVGQAAKAAAHSLSLAPAAQKVDALQAAAAAIRSRSEDIVAANAIDMAAGADKGLSKAMLDRLLLSRPCNLGGEVALGINGIAVPP